MHMFHTLLRYVMTHFAYILQGCFTHILQACFTGLEQSYDSDNDTDANTTMESRGK